jgi:hypothetical protein
LCGVVFEVDEPREQLFVIQVGEHSAPAKRRQMLEHLARRISRHRQISRPVDESILSWSPTGVRVPFFDIFLRGNGGRTEAADPWPGQAGD